MKQALIDATLELLRVMVLAVIPVLVDSLLLGEVNYRSLAIVAVVAGLRWLDKFLHKFGESSNRTVMEGGLTRF
jgi:hypothetical protein